MNLIKERRKKMAKKTIFARAFPQICKIEETYFYKQEISKNPTKESMKSPLGSIEIVIPYDGYQYLPRKTTQDIMRFIYSISPGDDAQIGHLALTN